MVKMVEVIVRDPDGRVVKRVAVNEDLFNHVLEKIKERPLDLATVWFLRILSAIFQPIAAGGTASASFVDSTGTSRSHNVKQPLYMVVGSSCYPANNFFSTYSCNSRLWVSYGSSSVAPTRSDYKLGNKLGEGLAGVAVDETGGTVTISASFTMTADTVIYEVGLEWEAQVGGGGTASVVCGRVLLDRTVFPNGITVLANQTITIVYRFFFP
jgi:hypothetical protein